MALDLGTLSAKLKLEDAEFQKKLRAAPADAKAAGKKVGDGLGEGAKQGTAKIGSMFANVGAAAVLGLGAAVVMGKQAVDQFAELQDATAAAGVTFGDSMGKIQQAADGAADSLGMSKQMYIDGALTMGTFGKSANLAGDDLAKFSNEMVAAAGDMASFRGTTPEEAIEAVGAALRGEMEPIRKYGVLLDDASLRQEALSMGLIKTTKEGLTPQVKVLAAQSAILKQTKDAQGDFARTSQSTANVQKTLAAETANAAAAFGEKLAPMLVIVQKGGIGVLRWATDNQAALVPMVGTVAALTVAFGGFLLVAKGIEAAKAARETIKGIGDAFQAMGTKAKVATISAGAVGIAVVALAAVYGLFADASARAEQATDDYTEAIKMDTGALGENTRAAVANRLEKNGALAAAQKLGISLDLVTDAVLGNGDAMAKIHGLTGPMIDDMHDTSAEATYRAQAANDLEKALGFEATQVEAGKAAYDRMSAAQKITTTTTQSNTAATNDGTISMKDYADAINGVYNAQLTLRGDQRSLKAAIDAATESVKKNGRTLSENTPKGRANAEALDGIARAGLSVVTSLQKTNAPAAKVASAMDTSRAAFIKAATSMGRSKEAAEKLADKLGLIKSKRVTVAVNVTKTGVTSIRLNATGGGRMTVAASYRAKGGPVRRGQPYIVGELGPELVTFPQDGNVHTASATKRMMAGSGGGLAGGENHFHAHFHVPVNPDVMGAGRQLEDLLTKYKAGALKPNLAFERQP